MKELVRIILNKYYEKDIDTTYKQQMIKICEMEDIFVNQLNDELKNDYRNLDVEKAQLQGIEAEQIIEMLLIS